MSLGQTLEVLDFSGLIKSKNSIVSLIFMKHFKFKSIAFSLKAFICFIFPTVELQLHTSLKWETHTQTCTTI